MTRLAPQGVQRLALVELAGDAGAFCGVGAVDEQEVGAHDASVLAERGGERRLWRRVLQPGDEQARGDPAALERCGRPEQVVVVLKDALRPSARAHDNIDGQTRWRAEEV
jgi:hypothetical protein